MSKNPRNRSRPETLTTLTTLTMKKLWKVLSRPLKHVFETICGLFKNTSVHETIRHVFYNYFRTSKRIQSNSVSSHFSDHRISLVSQNTSMAKILRFQENPRKTSKSELQGISRPFWITQIMYANSGRCQT